MEMLVKARLDFDRPALVWLLCQGEYVPFRREWTCRNDDGWCSECEHFLHDGFNWCPWCGAKVVKE